MAFAPDALLRRDRPLPTADRSSTRLKVNVTFQDASGTKNVPYDAECLGADSWRYNDVPAPTKSSSARPRATSCRLPPPPSLAVERLRAPRNIMPLKGQGSRRASLGARAPRRVAFADVLGLPHLGSAESPATIVVPSAARSPAALVAADDDVDVARLAQGRPAPARDRFLELRFTPDGKSTSQQRESFVELAVGAVCSFSRTAAWASSCDCVFWRKTPGVQRLPAAHRLSHVSVRTEAHGNGERGAYICACHPDAVSTKSAGHRRISATPRTSHRREDDTTRDVLSSHETRQRGYRTTSRASAASNRRQRRRRAGGVRRSRLSYSQRLLE